MHPVRALIAAALLAAAACSSGSTSPTTAAPSPTATTSSPPPTTSPPAPTTSAIPPPPATETAAPSTTAPPTDTTAASEPAAAYFVVAEERARRLAVFGPVEGFAECLAGPAGGCQPFDQVAAVELPAAPHNLAAAEGAVFATHPRAGSMSRLDLITGEVTTVELGPEPHDVKYSPADGLLLVADEAGRRLLWVDPGTLEIVDALDLPHPPHDLALGDGEVWVTMTGTDSLALVRGRTMELLPTGGAPHDLIVAADGRVWFSNWGSHALNVYDPTTGETADAPAHVVEPHHFALGPGGDVWVTDNGGAAVHRTGDRPAAVEVGPTPHHLAFAGPLAGVAVSGSGEAVFVFDDRVVHRAPLSSGLHGVAVAELPAPIPAG